ncbi:enoyl-CoA hydratase/isomerase family protein [Streptomyces sp. WI04-05B]|uniref:enoyl-CoA hydratase/isomerase family protein n=1 Tax=Streptomyces TaxID=1883 RepID=UPI0029B30EC9|nr:MULTISPECIES: enoyl-CoA hydratase/isomerase family protein [unclassified Streptomyces]MDX2541541.1 enoyl-CoA hydratase/isomerase family protein [Streptomyces sp. WI04-05B]MDX2583725.1 enoyl-CoA hydratase/isomerase family protein [Streptomyces sp. WI04-05A]MDX3745510.1 enoyl-CoA hydratase/isomerase family protein [Streptomyces sp. AK08-02]
MGETDSVLTVTADGDVRVVTLNRPDRLNGVSEKLHRRLAEVWRELADDPRARAVVLTGAGRAFSAGGDFDHLRRHHTDPELRERSIRLDRAIQTELIRFPLPVVAAVNGPAVGLGCSLALGCDLVLMADDAYLADPHISVGLVAGDGGVTLWPLLTSLLRVKEYLFTGDRVPAETAVQLGLANRVVPAADLRQEALALAHRLAAQPPEALRATKAALAVVVEQATRGGMEAALMAERATMTSPDHIRIVDELASRAERRAKGGEE